MADDFRVEMIGHATLRVRSGGRTLLADPWLVDPIGCRTGFHFPPLVHDVDAVAAGTDAIYVSHPHPDHLNVPTLARFPRSIPIYIGAYRQKDFRDRVRALGFRVIEVPFEEPVAVDGTDFTLAILEHDLAETAAYDSAAVIGAPGFTVFENNDCVLRPEKYAWVRERWRVDYAFLGYSPASFFPICFEMDPAEKARLLAEASERRYGDFVDAATRLDAALSVPFGCGLRFLHERLLWKNVLFNSPPEAVRRLGSHHRAGAVMEPGDRIDAAGVVRVGAVRQRDEEPATIAAYARERRHWVEGFTTAGEDVPGDAPDGVTDGLIPRFRDHILELRRDTRSALPGVGAYVIAYVVHGPPEARFHFDFSRPDGEAFRWGDPLRYDMRYTYAARHLAMALDGEVDWDELHFTGDVSVHQVRYARDFYLMLRSRLGATRPPGHSLTCSGARA